MPTSSRTAVDHGLSLRGALRATLVDEVALKSAVQIDAVDMKPAGSKLEVVAHDVVELPSDDPQVRRYQTRVRYATIHYTDVVKEIRVAAAALAGARIEDGVLVAEPVQPAPTVRRDDDAASTSTARRDGATQHGPARASPQRVQP